MVSNASAASTIEVAASPVPLLNQEVSGGNVDAENDGTAQDDPSLIEPEGIEPTGSDEKKDGTASDDDSDVEKLGNITEAEKQTRKDRSIMIGKLTVKLLKEVGEYFDEADAEEAKEAEEKKKKEKEKVVNTTEDEGSEKNEGPKIIMSTQEDDAKVPDSQNDDGSSNTPRGPLGPKYYAEMVKFISFTKLLGEPELRSS